MNKFQNRYVEPDSFYRNPQTTYFYLNREEEFKQKETKRSRKSRRENKSKKQASYIEPQLEKITNSKPLIFSPPKVDAIQMPLNEDPLDELQFNMDQSEQLEDEKMDKEEVVSSLMKEFSQMLNDTSTVDEQFTTFPKDQLEKENVFNMEEKTSHYVQAKNEDSDMLFTEFHSELNKPIDLFVSVVKDIQTLNEKIDTMEEKYFTLLTEIDELPKEGQDSATNEVEKDVSKENTNPLEEKYLNLLTEIDESPEAGQDSAANEVEKDVLKENTNLLEEKYVNMLTEIDELPEKKQDRLFTNVKDPKCNEPVHILNDEQHSCHHKPFFKGRKKRRYYINKNTSFNDTSLKDIDDESFFQKNNHFIEKKTTTVKMQVLLANLKTEIDIVETIDFPMPLDNITKVEWSIQSIDCKVVLPSKTVFLKGEFIAQIEFSSKEAENNMQSLKICIPWSKTTTIHWLSIPNITYSRHNEFMFQSQHEHDCSFHYESYYKFSEPVRNQIDQINFVWHQHLNTKDKQVQFNGVAQLDIQLMQEQFVELDGLVPKVR